MFLLQRYCLVLFSAFVLVTAVAEPIAAADGRFVGEVVAKWLPSGREMQLTAPFRYVDARGKEWAVPAGVTIDGASIPRVLWTTVGPPFTGKYRKASVVHDYFCLTMSRPWQDVHQIFFEASLVEGNTPVHARMMYAAVYAWGPRWEFVDGKPVRTRDVVRLPTDQEFQGFVEWIKVSDRSLAEIAAEADVRFPRTKPIAEKRVALVIGNSSYQHAPKLANPGNDAADMAESLKQLGYEVLSGVDLDKAGMDRTIRDFARALGNSDAGLFFYAGHGLQVGGQNYLVPIDAKLEDASGLDFEMIRLDLVQRTMERESKTNIVFLDACRDNPLARNLARAMGTRSVEIGRGLAPVESGVGTLISFSTQPGAVALDGTGRNSPYSGALVRRVRAAQPEDLSTLLIGVRNEVIAATKNKQVPWEHSALRARFFLGASPKLEAQHPSPHDYDKEMEIVFWNAVKESKDPDLLSAYVERFPTGTFAGLARLMVERINREDARKTAEAGEERQKRAEEAKKLAAAKTSEPRTGAAETGVLARAVQTELKRVGCDPGPIDGEWNTSSKEALREFSRVSNIDPGSDQPSQAILNLLAREKNRICPSKCDPQRGTPDSCPATTTLIDPDHLFDGAWTIVSTSTTCRNKAGRFIVTVAKGTLSGGVSGDRSRSGRVSPSGTATWTSPAAADGKPLIWSGKFQGNQGTGTYARADRKCNGTFKATRS